MRTPALLLLLAVCGSARPQGPGLNDAMTANEAGLTKEAVAIAVRVHEEANARNATDLVIESDVLLVELYHALGEPRLAIAHAIDARARDPEHPALHRPGYLLDLIDVERSLGLLEQAEERLKQLLDGPALDATTRAGCAARYAGLLTEAGRDAEAREQWNALITMLNAMPSGAMSPDLQRTLAGSRPADPLQALSIEERLLSEARQRNDLAAIMSHANNCGRSLMRAGRLAEAGERYELALAQVAAPRTLGIRYEATMNRAVLWSALGRREEAVRELDVVARECARSGRNEQRARALVLRGGINYKNGLLTAAADDATQALDLADAGGLQELRFDALDLLASIARLRGQSAQVASIEARIAALRQEQASKAEQELRQRGTILRELQATESKAMEEEARRARERTNLTRLNAEAEGREAELALLRARQELESAHLREVALERERAQKELSLTAAALQAEKRERTIAILSRDKELALWDAAQRERRDSLELLERANKLLLSEARLGDAEAQEQRAAKQLAFLLLALAATAGGALAHGMVVYRRKNREIHARGQAIERMNREVSDVNEKILGSIDYARHIQSAITPGEDVFRELLPGSFLVYRPLDVVSGDLPYLHRVGDSIYVGAIDCTGHGVPAAMLSFIAHYSLTHLIDTMHGAPCGEILAALHASVRDTLRTQNPGLPFNDGMDLSLCRIDRATGSIQFAGAQLPVIITSEQGVEVVRGDRVSLGDRAFNGAATLHTHHRHLDGSARLYILSDGYIHQFGGEHGLRKFSLQRLAHALEGTQRMSPDEARDHLTRLFDEWRNGVSQTDDVLLIGISRSA
ncbi:MAG: SpoIIE family protein phosphatase [Flavobacteriales bacterium]|nr:SpoIIE family protein phosphatase [Flavobacteriales bacterium]